MAEDGDGAIWLSYNSGELGRIQEDRAQTIAAADGPPGEGDIWLASDARRQLWFARGPLVGMFRDGRFVTLLTQQQPVVRIAGAHPAGVWLTDGRQVWKYREGKPLFPLGPVPAGEVKILHADRRGRLWVGAKEVFPEPLYCHEGGRFRPVPPAWNSIVSLADDADGNLWVSTRRTGLILVRPRTVELLRPVADVPRGVFSFCEDREGSRFAAGVYGVLFRWEGSAWEQMTSHRGWPGGAVTCLAAAPRGGVWLGTATAGLYQWREQRFVNAGGLDGVGPHPIRALWACANGDLWVGGDWSQGLRRLRGGATQAFALPPGAGGVAALAEDPDGAVWAASTDGRLVQIRGDAVADRTPLVVPAPIRCLHFTPDGSLWIGYAARGLGRLRGGRFCLFGPAQGLGTEAVCQILSDDYGRLWGVGGQGIFRVKIAELDAVAAGTLAELRPVLCGPDEGWPAFKAEGEGWPQAVRSRAGELCLPVSAGLAVIQPGRTPDEPPPPVVVIERLSVNGRPVAAYDSAVLSPRDTPARLVDLRGLTNRLSLGRGVRQLGLEFNVVALPNRANVRFRYRLRGLDDTWADAGPSRTAYFGPLPPGRYQFQVCGCNNSGVWNTAGATLALAIAPYFWQTWWFHGLLGCAALGLAGGAVWLGMRRRWRRQVERLESRQALDRERLRIAHDIHDEMGSSLTKVRKLISSMDAQAVPAAAHQPIVRDLDDTTRRIITQMDAIVWTINPGNDTLENMANYLVHYTEKFLHHTGIACRFDVPLNLPARPVPAELRHNLFRAVQEILNNAVRHGAPTLICFSLALADGVLTLAVQDNGRGFTPRPPAAGQDGLTNIHSRLAALGGHCRVDSAPGQGTTVTLQVRLPAAEK